MVIHILKNGTQVNSIENHVVRKADTEQTYEIIQRMNNRKRGRTNGIK